MPGNVEIVRELYRAFREKDYDAFVRICDPGIQWIQNDGFPGGGHHIGAEAVVEKVFRAFNTAWETWRFAIDEYLDAGATVIVIGRYEATHKQTGKAMVSAAAHVYDLKDGRITRFRQFADTKPIWDAMGA